MDTIKRHTITAALPYANGPVHIGHLAGVYVPADIYARYMRMKGEKVLFVCGSDEHGVPITIRAKKEGVTPQEVVNKYHKIIGDSFKNFGISFDIYSRTSSEVHHKNASEYFKKLHTKGVFVEKESEQYYDEENKQFLADRYITGTCPHCSSEGAYGDQCEKCGSSLSADDLINPKSSLSGNKPIRKATKHWYLPLDKYEDDLKKWITEDHKNDWKSNVLGQCKSWLDQGLQPRAVTRDLNWGVPVEGADGKVLYVWFDAPIGYISATQEWATANNENWEDYWKKDNGTNLVHFIGKDNIVFHCIIFPSMLMADGDLTLPSNVPANEFLNLEGDKISTSRNWAVWLNEYLQDFPEKQDALRYTLCANAPETKDNDFTWKDFQLKNNSELVAILGNFVNRAVVLTHKYYDGKVPVLGTLTEQDEKVLATMAKMPIKTGESIANYKFRDALSNMMGLARLGNKYLADTEPWKLIKTDEGRVKTIMNIALQIAANLSIITKPFIPFTADKLSSMLNLSDLTWEDAGKQLLDADHQINAAELLFTKIEDSEIDAQIEKLAKSKAENELANKVATPIKNNITFDDFTKLDIRTATILTAEKIKKTDKLLKLTLDTGIDTRTVVSGIAKSYKPEDIIGKRVSVLLNLEPRKIKGVESQGMILMAENSDGELAFVSPEKDVDNGSGVA